MIRYIIKRLVYAVLTLFVLISLTFFMMRMLPGDPFIGDKTVSATAMANMNAKYGLDKPVFVQYLMYMGNCLRGDLGISITYNRDVMTIISESFLVSADLGIRAIIFAVIIGILLGAVAAIKRRQRVGLRIHVHRHDRRLCAELHFGRGAAIFPRLAAAQNLRHQSLPDSGLGQV